MFAARARCLSIPGGGGDTHVKVGRILLAKFKLNPLRRQIWVWHNYYLTPERNTSKTHRQKRVIANLRILKALA